MTLLNLFYPRFPLGKIFNPEMSFDASLVCREKYHEKELLTSFCEQCKVCICNKCGQTRHSHHTKVNIDQAAKECKVNIEEIAEEMKKGVADFQIQMERSKERTRKSREEIAAARNKALTSLEELMRVFKEYETTTMSKLDVIEQTELRGHATQLDHFQASINQLQKCVQYCEAILQRNKSIEILQVHRTLVERCRGLINVEKLNISKPLHTALHARYEINDELAETLRSVVPGRLFVSNTDHLQSVAEGKGLKEAHIGNEAHFLITTKDSNEMQCYDEDDQVFVKVETPSGEELNHKITNCKDGTYSVTYTPDCVGQHDVVIEVNRQLLPCSPWHVHVTPHCYRLAFSFGSHGEAEGQFRYPYDIAIDTRTGSIAVADNDNNRVQLFSSEGKHLNTMGAKQLTEPTSVAFTTASEVIAIASDSIFWFNKSGELVKTFVNKHLKDPFRLTIARDGRMVVCDWGDNTVKVLSPDGTRLLLTISDPDRGCPWFSICHQDLLVVCYRWSHNVKVFSKDGAFLHSIGARGSGESQLKYPAGLTTDSFSNLVVCDADNKRLQIFSFDGRLLNTIEGQQSGLAEASSVALSTTGQLFVSDVGTHSVYVFQ